MQVLEGEGRQAGRKRKEDILFCLYTKTEPEMTLETPPICVDHF